MARVSHSPRRPDEPITRREPDGRERTAASRESLTERLIREAGDRIEALLQQARRSSAATEPRLRRQLSALADTHDDAVRRLESLAPTPRQHRQLLDRGELKPRSAAALWTDSDPA